MRKEKFVAIIICMLISLNLSAKRICKVSSPNGNVSIILNHSEEQGYTYTFVGAGESLIEESNIGYLSEEGAKIPAVDWVVADKQKSSVDGEWRPLWGKRETVKDQYKQMMITLKGKGSVSEVDVYLRAYNDGAAIRYVIPKSVTTSCKVAKELTNYNFADDYSAWFYNGEYHNIGPEKLSEVNGSRKPVMTVKIDDQNYMALHEANLTSDNTMLLKSKKDSRVFEMATKPSMLKGGFQSPWRVIFYGDNLGVMVDSHMIELLNPDPDPNMDFSWVKPSVALWDWRINGAEVGEFTYKMDYPSWIRMVDFAAKQGFKFLVLDANWYGPEFQKNSNPTVGDKAKDVKRLIEYGKNKGVGIWLYLNDVGGRQYPLEQTLKQYGDWGAAGVKYGFMRGSTKEKIERTKLITQLCAENRLLVDYHDSPIHPYGQMRTYPNAVTSEYCHAQLDAHRVFQPETFVTSVFVNMIAGPIDMNNGMFDLRQGHTTRVDESQPVPSTLVSEAARTQIVFSGATILPDIPEFYEKYPSLLRFITAQKMPWVESRTLAGEIGEYIVMMRETNDAYLVGIAANEQGRKIDIPLNFLPKKTTFKAELTTDGADAHYINNRESLDYKEITLSKDSKLSVQIAPGGGACLLIKK